MSNNPFSPPVAEIASPTDGAAGIRSRVFRKSMMSFTFVFSRARMMDRLRLDAQDFINREVGAANVVSIVENVGYEYSIIVWFRVG